MFELCHKELAMRFSTHLANREFKEAISLCSAGLRSKLGEKELADDFNDCCPLEYGEVESVDLLTEEDDPDVSDYDFIYVGLHIPKWGNSEAIIINSFISENDELKINGFEIGRP